MADVTENGLRAAVKALNDVVAPAITSTDPLAAEQLRLVVDYLEFIRARLDLLHDRDRFELAHNLSMARQLAKLAAPCTANLTEKLQGAIQEGEKTLLSPASSSVVLKATSANAAAAVSEVVKAANSMKADVRNAIERTVLQASEDRIAFDRAWYMPLGFEPAPWEVAPLTEIIGSGMQKYALEK